MTQEPLILVGQPRDRHRHLSNQTLQFCKYRGIDPYPLAGDLNERFGEVAIEAVCAATLSLEASTQDAFEAIGRKQTTKRNQEPPAKLVV